MLPVERILALLNQILASFTTILAFFFFAYIVTYNHKGAIGKAFAILLACVCLTYAGDVALFQVSSFQSAIPWLKFQWLGIAFIPAAYLHFSDALLRTTNAFSKIRQGAVLFAYGMGAIFLYLVITSSLLVQGGFFLPGITQFQAGSIFWLFTIYFFAAVIWGFINTLQARKRCLTSATRRRMTVLAISFAAPACGVFPYMLVASQTQLIPGSILLGFLLIINLSIDLMIFLMAYNVSFFDAFAPDRVVRYRLVTWFLRGPLVAGLILIVILALPDQPFILGLPHAVVQTALIVAIVVLAPLAANYLKSGVSRLIYWPERHEVELLRSVDARLVTSTDLRQALENILTAICELLRVRTGFVANVAAQSGPRLETSVGQAEDVQTAISQFDSSIFNQLQAHSPSPLFVSHAGFWYAPLRTDDGRHTLGLMGIEGRSTELDLTPYEAQTVAMFIEKAEFVLADRRLQQSVFNALRGIMPELERSQRVRGAVRYLGSPVENLLNDSSPIHEPDFAKMVHEALSHYWGGPKLMDSPLMQLRVVQQAIEAQDGNTVNALRSVLGQAIENVRPDGERKMTTSEWLFYNILELKFIRGLKVRDIASRLAMSEADFYRKQKIAVQAVARSLSEMESRGE